MSFRRVFRLCRVLPLAAVALYAQLRYPQSRKVEQVDVLHGVRVADPYRWLEDANSPQTKQWIEDQNKLTFSYLRSIPERDAIRHRLQQLWDYERFSSVGKHGPLYVYRRNSGLQNQDVVYVQSGLKGEPRVLLDPNTFSSDGTVALTSYNVSRDHKILGYRVSEGGSDWQEARFLEIETGKHLPDRLQWLKFTTLAWTKDHGVFYVRYQAPDAATKLQQLNSFPKLYFHRLGTPQSDDQLIYERKDQKEWGFYPWVPEDGQILLIYVSKGTSDKNALFYQDLRSPGSPVIELLRGFDAEYSVIGKEGSRLLVYTTWQAPRGRVIAIDLGRPAREHWQEIIPQAAEKLTGAGYINRKFLAVYLKDARSEVRIFDAGGRLLRNLALPGLGTVGGLGGRQSETETFYTFASFTTPGTIYRLDLNTLESTVFREPRLAADLTPYETRQVFYHSKDGARVPMFLTCRKDIRLDGANPVLLTGYGGFNSPRLPGFSAATLGWLEMGGVYASANLRGGGEYGDEWHEAGMKLRKQNVFDDFIAAGEWLIANRYTTRKKLAIMGGSNGGLLVGACLNQRPDLFGAAVPQVGVMDMLRFHKFTIGWAWVSDYGSPDNPEEFKAIYAYSPLHNIKPGARYPATLVTTADHDDRVVPAHSFKYAAALQAAQAGPAPIVIRIQTRAGHGSGKPVAMRIEETADIYAFLVKNLGIALGANWPAAASNSGQ
ncbi:MAG: S9 family peptidase [Acidobacteria bacterium]|nr:S9 family peptidase [Acidobacteriota bacterium]